MPEKRRKQLTLVAAILGLSVTVLDATVVFIALPAIERDLHFGLAGQQWVVNAYLLPLSALLLLGGALGDRYGRRRMFVLGLVTFGAGALSAGLAPNAVLLLGARVVQGLGAALLMPATLALVTVTFSGEERGGAIGAWAAWSGAAAAVGPLVAGVAIDALSWRWVFFLEIPVVVAALVLALAFVQGSRAAGAGEAELDLPGAALAVATLGGLAFALVQGPAAGWRSPAVALAALTALAGAAAFVRRERRAPNPLLPLGLFRARNFSAGNGTTLAVYAVLNGNFFILSIYLQSVLGYSPLQAGAATLPITLLMITLSSWTGRLSQRIGPRAPMTLGPLLAACGFGVLAFVEPGDGYWTAVLPGVALFGIGLATTVAPLTTAVMNAVSERQAGIASGVNNAVARTAGLLGVALIGALFAVAFRAALPPPGAVPSAARDALAAARQRPTSALEAVGEDTPQATAAVRRASVTGYRAAMGAGAAMALTGGVVSFVGIRSPRAGTPRAGGEEDHNAPREET